MISNFSIIVGLNEHAYGAMPRVEEMLVSYLSPEAALSPTKPCRMTSNLVGKANGWQVRLVHVCILWPSCRHTRLTC